MYKNVSLYIDGAWGPNASGRTSTVVNPASGKAIGTVALADREDLNRAVAAAEKGFEVWRKTSSFERYKLMRTAANLLRERAESIALILTLEQGKPLVEARGETLAAADIIDWFAEEGRRAYGRIIPARQDYVQQLVIAEPVGTCAAFTPWNFPLNQVVRKLSGALAAGCSIIIKAPEETPGSPAELVRAFADAGVPDGVINLVFGVPADVSSYLISHPSVRKISFTGSTAVGKELAALAGRHMKRATMELGGHAPVLIFDDADLRKAARLMAANKFRNAGQVCISPTRFLVQEGVYKEFVSLFVAAAQGLKVGNGLDESTHMGPLANQRRVVAMERHVENASAHGKVLTGGTRIPGVGNFFSPTVVSELDLAAITMQEEPFGPIAVINPFKSIDDGIAEANRLPYGLAAYAWTRSARTAHIVSSEVQAGMISINHLGLAAPEVPFGGVKDSGYGSEGGSEAIQAYLNPKFVTLLNT